MIDFISTKVGRIMEYQTSKARTDSFAPVELDHCFEFLTQVIMCHGDVSMTYWFVALEFTLDYF